MISESSPVIDFYPQEFDLDLNGKLQEWEAVVLIPFIDEVNIFSNHYRSFTCFHQAVCEFK